MSLIPDIRRGLIKSNGDAFYQAYRRCRPKMTFCLPGIGADASTPTSDYLGNTLAWNGGGSTAFISISQSKWYTSSIFTNGGSVRVTNPLIRDWRSDFTMFCWVYLQGITDGHIVGSVQDSGNYNVVGVHNTGKLRMFMRADGVTYDVLGTTTLSTGVWYFVEYSARGRVMKVFLNGATEITQLRDDRPSSIFTNEAIEMIVGNGAFGSLNGFTQDVSVFEHACLNIRPYTPPSMSLMAMEGF